MSNGNIHGVCFRMVGPVWVALERHRVRLQTISIPLDRGCKIGWQTPAGSCPLLRQERNQCEGSQEEKWEGSDGDVRLIKKRGEISVYRRKEYRKRENCYDYRQTELLLLPFFSWK